MPKPIMQYPFWDVVYFGNTVFDYAAMFLSFFVFLLILKIIQSFIIIRLRRFAAKTATDLDDVFVKIIESLRPPFYAFVAAYFASKTLVMSGFGEKLFTAIIVLWVTYQIVIALEIFIDYIIGKRGDESSSVLHLAGVVIKTAIWVFAILTALSNLGINVTSLVAGLGIGGVAVALAAQNILGDLFNSFVIYLDKPFAVGDFILVGDISGVVEKTGIKTTRIRALQGEEIVVPNKDITSAQIHNFKRMRERRIAFSFGVTYETPDKKLAEIPLWVKDIIEREPNTRFDRAHFKEFGDSALLFETVYFVLSSDYAAHMDARQNINLGLRDKLNQEGVHMAYPTQTVHLAKNG